MNVNGLPSSLQSLLAAQQAAKLHRDANAAGATQAQNTTSTTSATAAAVQAKPATVSTMMTAQAPEGTDPALWSVLTGEERAFFSRVVTSGPLTYSRMAAATTKAAAMPSIRGGRIDFRA